MFKYPLNVTIDSNIFDANKYDLAKDSTLNLLRNYVEKKKIKVFLSNIVINEIMKHIQDNAYQIAASVNGISKDIKNSYPECLIRSIGIEFVFTKANRKEMARKAREHLQEFLDKLNVEILDSSCVDVETIMNDYFNFNPPFENNEKKRKEFPDAFIAAQIKKRFNKGEQLAIISNDKGFKRACGSESGYMYFDSLGELYDRLSKEEQTYNESVSCIDKNSYLICLEIESIIEDNDCVEVRGISCDKDGIQDGYEYSETIVQNASNASCKIHTIDNITDNQVSATLVCSVEVDVDCYYEDYDNAAWDSEIKSYIFVETREIKEIHKVRFGVRVEIDRETEEYKLSKFTVILGEDSRIDRYEIIDDEDDYEDYEQEILDMDRESVGLTAMGNYESFLEETYADSDMFHDFQDRFETINSILSSFEERGSVYDEVLDVTKNSPSKVKELLMNISKKMDGINEFPLSSDIAEITDDDIEEFNAWVEDKYQELEKYIDMDRLPDNIDFGSQISFLGAEENTYTLSIDEIQINPSEGEEEYIDIGLSNSLGKTWKGYIKLTVGYQNYDEDGGAADGIEDDVEFVYDQIIEEMDNVLFSLKECLDSHINLTKILEDLLEEPC